MRTDALSRRYAEALADVAESVGALGRVRDELQTLGQVLERESAFATMVRTSAKPRDEKKAVFAHIGEQLGLSACTQRLLEYLVEKKRADHLPQIARAFVRVADERLGIIVGEIVSASVLSDEQSGRLTQKLEQLTGSTVRLQATVDEGLIAGFQVRLDGRFYDGSLRARLDRIKERIAHAG